MRRGTERTARQCCQLQQSHMRRTMRHGRRRKLGCEWENDAVRAFEPSSR